MHKECIQAFSCYTKQSCLYLWNPYFSIYDAFCLPIFSILSQQPIPEYPISHKEITRSCQKLQRDAISTGRLEPYFLRLIIIRKEEFCLISSSDNFSWWHDEVLEEILRCLAGMGFCNCLIATWTETRRGSTMGAVKNKQKLLIVIKIR